MAQKCIILIPLQKRVDISLQNLKSWIVLNHYHTSMNVLCCVHYINIEQRNQDIERRDRLKICKGLASSAQFNLRLEG